MRADPFKERIHDEVEEFLRDLALEFPFPIIFELLRKHEFKDRFGSKVVPLPRKRGLEDSQDTKAVQNRMQNFIEDLEKSYGRHHRPTIDQSFKYFSSVTFDS